MWEWNSTHTPFLCLCTKHWINSQASHTCNANNACTNCWPINTQSIHKMTQTLPIHTHKLFNTEPVYKWTEFKLWLGANIIYENTNAYTKQRAKHVLWLWILMPNYLPWVPWPIFPLHCKIICEICILFSFDLTSLSFKLYKLRWAF